MMTFKIRQPHARYERKNIVRGLVNANPCLHYKLFAPIIDTNQATIFVTVSHFHPSLIFVGKAKRLLLQLSLERVSTQSCFRLR
jgi:hypothetical protein